MFGVFVCVPEFKLANSLMKPGHQVFGRISFDGSKCHERALHKHQPDAPSERESSNSDPPSTDGERELRLVDKRLHEVVGEDRGNNHQHGKHGEVQFALAAVANFLKKCSFLFSQFHFIHRTCR